jgi:hyperosmotically inducible protein
MCACELNKIDATKTIHPVYKQGQIMKTNFALTCLACGTLLGSVMAIAGEDSDTDRAHPVVFVKDSAITTQIKSKLAVDHLTSLGRIHVDTDKDGIVWLGGSARTQEAADKAVAIARETEGVKSVHSNITIKLDD